MRTRAPWPKRPFHGLEHPSHPPLALLSGSPYTYGIPREVAARGGEALQDEAGVEPGVAPHAELHGSGKGRPGGRGVPVSEQMLLTLISTTGERARHLAGAIRAEVQRAAVVNLDDTSTRRHVDGGPRGAPPAKKQEGGSGSCWGMSASRTSSRPRAGRRRRSGKHRGPHGCAARGRLPGLPQVRAAS